MDNSSSSTDTANARLDTSSSSPSQRKLVLLWPPASACKSPPGNGRPEEPIACHLQQPAVAAKTKPPPPPPPTDGFFKRIDGRQYVAANKKPPPPPPSFGVPERSDEPPAPSFSPQLWAANQEPPVALPPKSKGVIDPTRLAGVALKSPPAVVCPGEQIQMLQSQPPPPAVTAKEKPPPPTSYDVPRRMDDPSLPPFPNQSAAANKKPSPQHKLDDLLSPPPLRKK